MTIVVFQEGQFQELNRKMDLNLAANKADDGCKIYTTEEVAKMLDVSKRTLQNYRDKGLITFSQVERKIYHKQEDVDSFTNNNKIRSYEK